MGVSRPLYEFSDLVRRMREAQRHYFSTRERDSLLRSKELEREVDACVRFILAPQPLDVPPIVDGLAEDEDTAEIVYVPDQV